MKKIARFFINYRLFSVALICLVAAIILYLVQQNKIADLILAIVSIFEVIPLVYDMWQNVRSGRYGIDILAATSIIMSIVLKQYLAAIVVVLMLTGGQSLEDYAEKRAVSELDLLLKNAPKTATVIRKNKKIIVPVDDILIGDTIVIKPGDIVPVDAEILDGQANFDESQITGESKPQFKEKGALLLSGTLNIDGMVKAKASALPSDSQYQQIIKLVKSAAASEAPFVRLADRYSLPFTISAYAIALTAYFLSGHLIRFLEVIIVATPCPLLLAAPIALISGMSTASRYGIIVKSSKALEKLSNAKTIAFDKTGTLTEGSLNVSRINCFNGYSEMEVLGIASSLENHSNHVIAHAIVSAASKNKVKKIKVKELKEIAGLGVKASVKSKKIHLGNLRFIKEEKIKLPVKFPMIKKNETVCYVAFDQNLIGIIYLTDNIRSNARQTLNQLHNLGIRELAMVTGDNKLVADVIAKKLGFDDVLAEALPADKYSFITKNTSKPAVFVGDGVNDAPVLTAADVGIALGARGSTAASESADMVIMLDDLSRVAIALDIAKKTFAVAKQSILIGIFLSLILMIIFAFGKIMPLYGALLQEVVDVFVIFNALRAHNLKPANESEALP